MVSVQVGLDIGGALLVQRFSTDGVAPRRTSTALQLSPTIGLTRELSERSYLYLLAFGSTYLMRSEDAQTQAVSFGPSCALRAPRWAPGFRL